MNPIGGGEKHIHIKFFLQSEKCPMYNYICTGILTSFLVRIQQVTAENVSKQKYNSYFLSGYLIYQDYNVKCASIEIL